MITAVDTNVLIDILEPDPTFGAMSRDAIKRCRKEGAIVSCSVVWAELATAYGHAEDDLLSALDRIGLEFSSIQIGSALKAAAHWHTYRRGMLSRDRIAADFLVGAHAAEQCDRLLTRDRGFYQGYFEGLEIVDPTDSAPARSV